MVRRILIPIDGSSFAEGVIPYAETLLAPDGDVMLLRVVPEPDPDVALLADLEPTAADDLGAEGRARAERDIELARDHFSLESDRVQGVVATGDPAEQIVRRAAEADVDLIAMTTHGRGAIGRLFFGSVANRVAQSTPVPLLLVRPADGRRPESRYRRLVVPYDGSAVAAEAFPLAAELSRQLRAPVHLVQAVYVPSAPVPGGVLANVTASADAAAARSLEEGVARLRELGVDASTELLAGSPFWAIAEAVLPGDLLVLTSHGRTGVRRWMLGSIAEKLVQQSPVPVILVPAAARRERTAI